MTDKPVRLAIRMYQVGFGDCLLLSFTYPAPLPDGRTERHVLIDFGSSRGPEQGTLKMDTVARSVAQRCGGKLDAVVVTHRHKDHVSGFGHAAAGKVLDGVAPALVVRPWTDDPAAQDTATHGLREGQEFARRLASLALPHAVGVNELRQLADGQVPNQDAIDRLERWAQGGKGEHLSYGQPTRLTDVLPGVKVRVLGPPKLKDWPELAEQRENDPQYWIFRQRELGGVAAEVTDAPSPPPTEPHDGRPHYGPVAWLIDRMRTQRVASLQRIIRALDDALNNTSVILLLEVEGRRLLLSGDAQVESWRYALEGAPDKETNRSLLSEVDVYKVGHHGSRNATPRSLYKLWTEGPGAARPMIALMSTRPHVHGTPPTTEVPRQPLIDALKARAELYTTTDLTTPFIELEADLTTGEPFHKVGH